MQPRDTKIDCFGIKPTSILILVDIPYATFQLCILLNIIESPVLLCPFFLLIEEFYFVFFF